MSRGYSGNGLEVVGLDALLRGLDEMVAVAEKPNLKTVTLMFVKGIRERVPVVSGELRDSIKVYQDGNEMVVEMGAWYAFLIERRKPFMQPKWSEVEKGRDMLAAQVVAPLEKK